MTSVAFSEPQTINCKPSTRNTLRRLKNEKPLRSSRTAAAEGFKSVEILLRGLFNLLNLRNLFRGYCNYFPAMVETSCIHITYTNGPIADVGTFAVLVSESISNKIAAFLYVRDHITYLNYSSTTTAFEIISLAWSRLSILAWTFAHLFISLSLILAGLSCIRSSMASFKPS